MKKLYVSFLAGILLSGLLFGFIGIRFLRGQCLREFQITGNLAGAALTENPELEEVFVTALQDGKYAYLEEGKQFLSQYGYNEAAALSNNLYYRRVKTELAGLILLFMFFSALLVTGGFFFFHKKREAQQDGIYALLDRCLAEDYSFLEQKAGKDSDVEDGFLDMLQKLGGRLQLKTTALSEERDNTKTLVTDISHQLKTPVSALKNCFTMYMEADTEKEREEFKERCAMQLEKLEHLVEALLHISQLETSLITLRPEETDLTDLLALAVDTVYMKAAQKKIEIEVQKEESFSPHLYLDKRWTAEALSNILDNAVKYSPAGSSIILRVQGLYSHICIEIEDSGIGVPAKEYNQIFKRFYRGTAPLVRNTEGAGVGLYLTRRIVEQQGGTVMVKPAPKQGSIFAVYLPTEINYGAERA